MNSRPPSGVLAEGQAEHSLLHAKELADELVERSARRFSPNPPAILDAQEKHTNSLYRPGRYEEAADKARQILVVADESRLGECHEVRVGAMYVLASSLDPLGESGEAAELRLRRLSCMRSIAKTAPSHFLSAVSDALPTLHRSGRAVEGKALSRELLAACANYGESFRVMPTEVESWVAHLVSMRGRLDDADRLYAEFLPRGQEMDSIVPRLYLFYAMHLTRRGCFLDAEEALQAADWFGDSRRKGAYPAKQRDGRLCYALPRMK